MINIFDLIVAGLALFYLLKNAGGVLKTIKNLLVVLLTLILLGIISAFLLEQKMAEPIHKYLKDSYFVKLSHFLIKLTYPTVEKEVPKVDVFIKEKIISAPTPEVKVITPEKPLPKITVPEKLKLK